MNVVDLINSQYIDGEFNLLSRCGTSDRLALLKTTFLMLAPAFTEDKFPHAGAGVQNGGQILYLYIGRRTNRGSKKNAVISTPQRRAVNDNRTSR